MGNNRSYRLHASLGYQISLTARLQERPFEDNLKAFGLTRITWCVLLAAGVENISHPSEIAEFIGIDRTATSRALRQMEAAGFIKRHPGTSDRRTTKVALTRAGADLRDATAPIARENAARFEEKLSPGEYEELLRLLAKLRTGETAGLTNL